MSEYERLHKEIALVCDKFGYKRCVECPLYPACSIKRKINETENAFAERFETEIVKVYKELKDIK